MLHSLQVPKPRRALNTLAATARGELPRPPRRQPWMKLLYLKQPYPDNFTNESFLSQLKRNTTVVKYSYWKLVDDFLLIAGHLANIFLVILIFYGIYAHDWNPVTPAIYSSVLTIVGFVVWDRKPESAKGLPINTTNPTANTTNPITTTTATTNTTTNTTTNATTTTTTKTNTTNTITTGGRSKVRSSMILIFVLLILSPVLKSLTKSTASDSIWATSFCLCIANTLFHEYAMASDLAECRPILSTNISFANAIVLASRLNSNIQVFCFVLTAIQINILIPVFDVHLRQLYAPVYHRLLAGISSVVVGLLIARMLNYRILVLWVAGQVGTVFLLPFYFLFLQKYKNELQGPWDPAKPIIKLS